MIIIIILVNKPSIDMLVSFTQYTGLFHKLLESAEINDNKR